jgi:hypothetical protein
MTTSNQEDQAERRSVLRDDARARNQSNGDTGTFLSHTHDDLGGGRFAALGAPTIVGRDDPVPRYPQASIPFQVDPVGDEPPLGVDINRLTDPEQVLSTPEPSSLPCPVQGPGPTSEADAPSPASGDEQRAQDVGPLSTEDGNGS